MRRHFRVWDRKTTRHKWRLCCETDLIDHANNVFSTHVDMLTGWAQWPKAQVGMDTIERKPGGRLVTKDDSALPQNAPMLRVWSMENPYQF